LAQESEILNFWILIFWGEAERGALSAVAKAT
jgi:hypothetical protein